MARNKSGRSSFPPSEITHHTYETETGRWVRVRYDFCLHQFTTSTCERVCIKTSSSSPNLPQRHASLEINLSGPPPTLLSRLNG